jgi:hypothetical protein
MIGSDTATCRASLTDITVSLLTIGAPACVNMRTAPLNENGALFVDTSRFATPRNRSLTASQPAVVVSALISEKKSAGATRQPGWITRRRSGGSAHR